MATIKFSDFTNQTVDVTNTQVVGYKVGDATANYRYSMAQLSAGVVSAYDKYEFTTNIFLSNAKTIGRDNGTIRNANLQFVDVAPSGNIGFSFRDGGSDKVFIDGSGKIGVGTTDPTASIDTDGSIFLSTNAKTIGRDNGIIRNANIQFADVSALGNHALSFRDGGSDLMVVDGGGKVGIGVTDPDSFLEVFGTTTQQKWSYDADSFATLTVADSSNTTLAVGETGTFTLDVPGDVTIDSDTGVITFSDGGASLATVASLRNECFMMACSDETTELTIAPDKTRIQMPYAFTLTEIKASLTTSPTGAGATTVNVYNVTDGDTVINTAALSFAAAAISANSTSFTAGQETIAEDAVIAVDVAAVAGTTGGAGLKVTLIGYQTV